MKVHDIEFKSSTMYRLLGEITKDRMDLDIIENIMKSDAGLMYKFIRFINSATNGLLRRVSDIKQSIMLIGEEQFKRWVLIFFYSDLSGTDNEKYANKAVVRGRFCELIMSQIDKSKKDDAFICGLLLDINVLLGKNIDEILEEMFMNDEINNALKGESGLIRDVMDIVINYNEMYSKKVEDLCEKLSLDKNTLYKLYLDSILWAKEL